MNEIAEMKQWCIEHYEQGASTMVECWSDEDYARLLEGKTKRQALQLLKRLAAVHKERQADADYYANNW